MANEVYKALNRIKELRIEKGVTQSTVAKAIGISQGMLTNYETGKRSPR
ncbi:helix-turn-helix domain-containing protein, partial [Klebsiella pneumoniae]